MATLIRADGTEQDVHPRGAAFELEEMYALIGCTTVELVGLADGRSMWLDEDGRGLKKPVNGKATALLHQAGGIPWDVVVGDALVTGPTEVE